jgi:hypothetical protein
MNGYLGEFPVDITTHPKYSKYTPADWAMLFIGKYSSIDGDHHKSWVFDQVARILKGTPVVVVEARWGNNHSEYRFTVANLPSEEYREWVKQMTSGVNEGYDWDEGIAP